MDNGTGAFMTTTVDNPSQSNQLWCLLDAGESNYYIVSKDGNYVSWGNGRFQTTKEVGSAVKLKVIQSSAYADYFEIQRNGASNNMNQHGGSGVGVQLGEWTPGDINNPLTFVEADALFSNGTKEYWYNIKFKNSNLQIQDNGIGTKATIQNIDMSLDAQQWKLVGNENQFQLISKNGTYANMQEADGTFKMFTKSEVDANGFALKQNGNGFEIKWNGAKDDKAYFNPWQGASVGKNIGLWSSEANNVVFFIKCVDDAIIKLKSLSELSNNKLYHVSQPYRGFTSWAVAKGGDALKSTNDLGLVTDYTDPCQHFAFITNDNGNTYYLYHAAEKKFVSKNGALSISPTDPIKNKVGAYDETFFFYFDESHHINVGGSKQMTIDTWSTADGGNSCEINCIGDFDPSEAIKAFGIEAKEVELTYHFMYDGIEKAYQKFITKEGMVFPDIQGLPFGAVATKPEGTIPVDGDTDYYITVTSALPFKSASRFEDITNWYNITLKRDYYLFYEENDEAMAIEGSKAVNEQNYDAYAWGFVGNPFDGYQIYNMKAGDGMILSSSTVMKGVTGAETYPVLTKVPVPGINNTHWIVSASSYYTNGFFLAQNGHPNNRMNLRQPNLAYWTGGADAGSTFNVKEVESAGAGFYMVVVLGTNDASAGVVYKGQTFKNHSVINAATALSVSSLNAMAVNGMIPSITIDGSKVYVSYFSNATRFYTLRGGHGGYVSLNSAYQTDGNLRLNNSEEPRDNKALWTFALQEDGTYMVYNFSTGLTKVLGITGKEANARTRMVSLGDNAYSTKFTGSFDFTGSEPSYIRIDGGNHWWNKRGDYFALWETSNGWNGDTGCKFFISEVDYEDYPDVYFYEVPTIEGVESFAPKNPNTLWYKTSAVAKGVSNPWMEYALPLGNGELGCMVFGGVHNEEIQFNEKTLWSGPVNQVGAGSGNRTFMNFGSVIIENRDKAISERVTDYVRYLDIEEGIAGVEFKNNNGSKFTRKYLSSAPDQVIAAQYKAEGADKMNLRFTVEPGKGINASEVDYYMDNNVGVARFTGAMSVSYAARLHVVANPGATVTASAKGITVVNATEVTFYLKGATNFNGDVDAVNNYFTSENVDSKAKVALDAAVAKGFNAIERAHLVNFTTLTNRMSLDLCLETPKRDTETLINNYQFNNDGNSTQNDHLFLEQLYFHYGRYLAISSNRKPIAAPSNLQGIWNNCGTDSPWNSDIHTNINVQMNYWPMESTNLSDLHMPFLNFIIRGAQSDGWKAVADRYNNGYGWSVLTETSLYNSMSTWGDNYLVANAWYTSHLWNHWRYTHNKDFLKKAFPVMWGAAEFWFNRLIKDRGFDSSSDEQESVRNYTPAYSYDPDGSYVAPNEFSAEQHDNQTEDGTAHAQQLISYLFQNLSDALSILGASEINISLSDISKLNHYLEKIDKGLHTETYTGTWGDTYNGVRKGEKLLREWKYSPYDISKDKGHRHMSHLMALYPLEQITPNSEYFTPAVNSLKLRGDAATGWSMGWKLNLWARALDGDHAHLIMKNALKHSRSYGTDASAGGIYYNMFDSHAPFQIDGNFGVCAGVAEMLMQSAHGYIHILPALPTVWEREGYVKGMKAVGNFVVDFNWYAGICQGITIRSNAGAPLRVYCKKGAKKLQRASIKVDGQEVMVSVDENGIATIPCEKGSVVTIDFTTTTELSSVTSDTENGTSDVYDLSGRRLPETPAGQVYIQNGQKKVSK